MKILKFKTSYESLISRCPGLFAYVELNEVGDPLLHRSTDNPLGCYGKIVESLKVNFDLVLNEGETLLENGRIYSYKSLMELFYKYRGKDFLFRNGYNDFIDFMDYRIGKKEVDFAYDKNKNDLVPEFIYLSVAKSLYSEMVYLKSCADYYVKHKTDKDIDIDIQSEKELQCKCIMFIRKGGNDMMDFLKNAVDEAYERSNIIYEDATQIFGTEDSFKINYSINLSTTDKDLGILTPFEETNAASEPFDIELSFKTNSKLKSLRRFKNYVNKFGDAETPNGNMDWLFYYRVGQVANISTINDDFGNIETDTTMGAATIEDINIGDIVSNLVAYGDVIENIELLQDENAIRFTYWTDAHLIAVCKDIDFDDDKNKIIKYGNFKIDSDYKNGIKYIETYNFAEDSEISDFSVADFNSYVNGDFDSGKDKKIFEKYEFLTYNNTVKTYKRINGEKIAYNSIISDSVETKFTRELSNDPNGLIRIEFYSGTSYNPTEEIDVNIERGVTSVFDKHIRFSEIKNLNELEKFSNGGFYRLN